MSEEQQKQYNEKAKKDKSKEKLQKERQKLKVPSGKRTTNTRMRRISGHR